MTLNTYLTFRDTCREAFEFYRSVFGGEFSTLQTFGDGPPDMGVPDEAKDLIMHVSLPVGDSILMGSDANPAADSGPIVGNNFSISYSPPDRDVADRAFAALSDGGEVAMPMAEMFWGAYFGSCTDRFGIAWMINVEPPLSD
ncbi:MAG: VOC family protein [Chloroflexi bacterium]|nr:VOC family protein [Chloroflexota bacterium]MCY3695652.1 VOC family protein [Chloroflexota bacterium]MXX32360.1 VOC family protein [Chloroflexota bacterium]MXX81643.1 VOC family protein [Chloroflexota bacterium]MYD16591.1 VOC family protein [Chloroflexota bacterium]